MTTFTRESIKGTSNAPKIKIFITLQWMCSSTDEFSSKKKVINNDKKNELQLVEN